MMAVGVSSGRPWKQGAWVTPAWPTVGVPPSQWGLCLPETPRCGLPPALVCSPPSHPRELPVSLEEGVGCYRAQPCQPRWPHQRHLPHPLGVLSGPCFMPVLLESVPTAKPKRDPLPFTSSH